MADPQAPVRTRHYPATPGLVARTHADVLPGEQRRRGLRTVLLEEALEAARPRRPALVGSAQGGISRLLFTVPSYAVESPPLAAIYEGLLRLLASSGLVILTHESSAAVVRGWLTAAGRSGDDGDDVVVEAPDHLNFSVWAEDGYVVVRDAESGATFFVEPYSFPRYGDGLVAELVSNATDLEKSQAPLYFQGGNVLVGDDFFLIGADYPAESLGYVGDVLLPEPGESPTALVRRLYGEYFDTDRRLVYVGATVPVPAEKERPVRIGGRRWTEILHVGNAAGTAQPVFHIDMFVTLAGRAADGRYRLLVGDPAMAAKLTGDRLPAHAMKEAFDSVARGLRRRGFEVIRNPLPLVYVDDPDARERLWYFATSNNALVETGRVILPTYGHGSWESLSVVDERNQEIWRELGYKVELLGDCHPLASNLGSVHCIKKYLARS